MSSTPSIVHVGSSATHAFGDKTVLVVGRSREADLPVYDPACSRRQFLVRREGPRFLLEPLSENNPTFCDGVRATGPTPITANTVIEAGASRFQLLAPVAAPASAPPPVAPAQAKASPPPLPTTAQAHGRPTVLGTAPPDGAAPFLPTIRIAGDLILGRDPKVAAVQLAHALVSRRHALVRKTHTGAVVKDLGSANGTFLNGKRLGVAVALTPGDRLQIGPFGLIFTGDALVSAGSASALAFAPAASATRLTAHQLCVETGGRRLLHNVSVELRGSEFVAVLGPSGCGKSTLLKALSGAHPPTDGRVVFEDCDLYNSPAGAARRIAVVPQREVLPTVLTVAEALRFTAALRLPPDTADADLERAVASALAVVGLADHRRATIATLSGGQLKRVGLANELLADPGLVLIDEVTSGLDEQADREMMGLFRQLANGGKTVVAVTHSLAHVTEYCHRVMILTQGGRLAFIGRPEEALRYFQIDRLGDVYERLNDRAPEDWAALHDNSPQAVRSPPPPAAPLGATVHEPVDTLAAVRHQTPLLAKRTARILFADRTALLVTFGQSLLIAALVVWVFGDVRNPADPVAAAAMARSILFVLTVTAFWFGCNIAAKEVVREWDLHRKERQAQLSPAAYLLAKWLVLTVVTAIQTVLLFVIVSEGGCHLPGNARAMVVLLAAVGAAGVSAGLLASVTARSEAVAVALVPVLIIPQIVLTNVFRPLTGGTKTFAEIMISSHHGFDGLLTALPPGLAAITAPSGVTIASATCWLLLQSVVIGLLAWKILDLRGRPQGLTLPPALTRLAGARSWL